MRRDALACAVEGQISKTPSKGDACSACFDCRGDRLGFVNSL